MKETSRMAKYSKDNCIEMEIEEDIKARFTHEQYKNDKGLTS